jgi:RNA polymerase sigma-70 factor (ECF subfamily)
MREKEKNMSEKTAEANLVASAKSGNQEAVQELLSKMEGLCRWGLMMVRWTGEVEDGLQEARMGIIIALEKFDTEGEAAFGTYAGWWVRKSLQRAMTTREYNIEEQIEKPVEEKQIGGLTFDDAELRDVARLMADLPEDDRALVTMRFVEDMTFEEMGKALGCHKYVASLRLKKVLDGIKQKIEV